MSPPWLNKVTIPYHTTPRHATLHHTIPYHTPYHTPYTIPIPYHTIRPVSLDTGLGNEFVLFIMTGWEAYETDYAKLK